MDGTEEKAPSTAEQTAESSERSNPAASNEAVKPSEEKGGGSSSADVTKTPEIQEAIKAAVKAAVSDAYRTFQSTRDKEMAPLFERLTKAEKEREEANLRQREADLQRDFDKQIDGEVADGTLTEERGAYLKDWRRKAREEFMATARDKEDVKHQQSDIKKSQLKIMVHDVIEEGEKQGKSFSLADARQIAEDSGGNPAVISRLIAMAPLADEKPEEKEGKGERKAPENSNPSSGGRDWRKLSAKDKIRDALEKEK